MLRPKVDVKEFEKEDRNKSKNMEATKNAERRREENINRQQLKELVYEIKNSTMPIRTQEILIELVQEAAVEQKRNN